MERWRSSLTLPSSSLIGFSNSSSCAAPLAAAGRLSRAGGDLVGLGDQRLGLADRGDVDQPAIEADRALALRAGGRHRLEDAARLLDLGRRRRHDLVGERDLARMDRPLALAAERRGAAARRPGSRRDRRSRRTARRSAAARGRAPRPPCARAHSATCRPNGARAPRSPRPDRSAPRRPGWGRRCRWSGRGSRRRSRRRRNAAPRCAGSPPRSRRRSSCRARSR